MAKADRFGIRALLCVSCAPIALAPAGVARAADYYIDNRSGSNCSNAGPGTSSAQPWCDFTNVNNRTHGPDTRILLARGATWDQEMVVRGSGSVEQPNLISAYGPGPRPTITRNGAAGLRAGGQLQRGVYLVNPSYWTVEGLHVTNAAVGIHAYYDTLGNRSLTLRDLLVTNIRGITEANLFYAYDAGKFPYCQASQSNTFEGVYQSAGIVIGGPYRIDGVQADESSFVLRGLTVHDVEGTRNATSLSIQFCNVLNNDESATLFNAVQDARFYDLYFHNDDGNGAPEGCMQSMSIVNTLRTRIYNTWIDQASGCYAYHGTVGLLFSVNKELTFTNSMITGTRDTSSADQGGIDFEYRNQDMNTSYNYFEGNAGPAIELLAIRPANTDFSNNHLIRANAFVNNGIDPNPNAPYYKSAISQIGGGFAPTGRIEHSLYAEPDGLIYNGGNFSGFTFANNRGAASAGDVRSSPRGYSGVQGQNGWSYQQRAGSNWFELMFDPASGRWAGATNGYPWIGRFTAHPRACSGCAVGRVWTAPRAGRISLRGRAFKGVIGGDGVSVRVTQNGATLWGPVSVAGNDQNGAELVLDDVTVAAGDVVRFEVEAGGDSQYDWVSWAPVVAYAPQAGPSVGNQNFESPTQAQGGFTYNPAGAAWTFQGLSGVQANGSAWTFLGSPAPVGTQAAFVQAGGCISQAISGFNAGTAYRIRFAAAQRGNDMGGQTVNVSADGVLLSSLTPASTVYTDVVTNSFTAAAASLSIQFCGTSAEDRTAFIDDVRIEAQ